MQNGVEVSPLKVLGETEKRGTEVHFLADEEIFGQVIEFHYDILAKRLRELSFLNNGVKIKLVDQRNGKEENFAFSRRRQRFCRVHQPQQDRAASERVSTPSGEANQNGVSIDVEVAMQWNDSYAEQVLCFTNNIPQSRRRHAPHRPARGDDAQSSTSTSKKTKSPKKPKSRSPATTCAKAWPACFR